MGSIAIVGAGNVGQAITGHMVLQGHDVRLFSRWEKDFEAIIANNGIDLSGDVEGHANKPTLTTDLDDAIVGADVVIVAAPAFAHAYLSERLAALLEPEQLVVFQPSVLGSSVELARHFALAQRTPCLIAETPTSLYTCRLRGPAQVFIGAIKQAVHLATIPHASSQDALDRLSHYFGDRYIAGSDTLSVGLGNCNAIYHVPPAVLNIKTVEDADARPHHTLVTPRVAEVINALDQERLALAEALGVKTPSFWEFLESAYGVTEGTHVERIVQGYGRQAFPEPDSLTHRYFTEDIPFGLVIWSSLAKQIGLPLPLTDSFIKISGLICGTDFEAEGRTADVLGIEGLDAAAIKEAFLNGVTPLVTA
ncbi:MULTISPECIES: NAD/NADP octopine/nopaline dehydrogenase family protein [unclassified Arthrobacter]|uniref:NAD/NADP octopine/nopaline dehydrogenase family protein n=1 Tax=unclassified Arthrobacter TaxID=235627 RepID=UPI002883305D|nr:MULTISPECIES: NAD/NADP octopine/nopaline dehydrogenase family protein [unclassified Arthrobacter]